ncbi:MAG: DUF2268 domain-containing putative Zn-dependent protease [Bacteroidia bacterium]
MKQVLFFFIFFILHTARAENSIHTEDITHFWAAYDSVLKCAPPMTSQDTLKQINILQTLYVDKASEGLKDFITARNFTAKEWLQHILYEPRFWKSLRPKTLLVVKQQDQILQLMHRFKKLYPAFKCPDIYYTIGCLRSGGTTSPSRILIGTEIAAADSTTDISELGSWISGIIKMNKGILRLVAHEAGHTQQHEEGDMDLLSRCIREGACDFIAELLLNETLTSPYLTYGTAHEKELAEKFEKEMSGKDYSDWLYNGENAKGGHADLGYFMGYVICKYYYDKAVDKSKAISEIITVNYSDSKASKAFYDQTGYVNKVMH